MSGILTKARRALLFIVVGVVVFVGLTGFSQEDDTGSRASDFLRYLQDSGNLVAMNSDEVVFFAEELKGQSVSDRVLYLSREAATGTTKEVLGSIYQSGILVVAIDTPISVLYDAVDSVPLGDSPVPITPLRELEDLTAPIDDVVVVSMIYSHNYIPHVNGYTHTTDFYAYPEHVELAAQAIVNAAEEKINSVDADALHSNGEGLDTNGQTLSFQCGVEASIEWTNGNFPPTSPRGIAQCPSGFEPFFIRVHGTMHHDCLGWHLVGETDEWNESGPYTVNEVSGLMSGFPPNQYPNYCREGGDQHKNPLYGTADITAEARDHSPSALDTDGATSNKTVFYPH